MKLEVGKFVRTKDGEIHKIKSINDEYIEYENGFGVPYELKEYIVKTSYNIIDILEEGDYVNGQRIYYDEELDFLYVQSFDADGEFYQESITKNSFIDNIKSVITHEQMEQMAYKVGD